MVEHGSEKPGVGSSILPLGTIKKMFTVYVLYNPDYRTYVGYSANFEKRFSEHNNIKGKKRGWTRLRGPWKVLYKEEFESKREALRKERELKPGRGREFIKKLIDDIIQPR